MIRAMRVTLLILACLVALAGPAAAGQKDPRLDQLFQRLQSTTDEAAAQRVQAQIWQIWSQSDSATVDLFLLQGTTAMVEHDFEQALSSFTAAIEAAPDFAEAWNKRATLFFLLGSYQQSESDIARTLALEPRHWGALAGLGQIKEAQGKDDDALDAYTEALAINPHLPAIKAAVERLKKRAEKNRT